MLAVKKLCDVQKAVLQADSGHRTLRREAPGGLRLSTVQSSDASSGCSSPRSPLTGPFQDSDLQTSCEDGLSIKDAARTSLSQESIDSRSRGSGRSQEAPPASFSPHTWSQENLEGSAAKERVLPEGWDQRPLKLVPLGTATVFKYPSIPAKPRGSGPHGSPALRGFSYQQGGSTALSSAPRPKNHNRTLAPAHRRTQNTTRCALSDGEPDEDEDAPGNVPAYATLGRKPGRKPGRSHPARLQPSPEASGAVGRSQSFAVRSRRKGPPPPPPQRLSSVSSPTSGELSDSTSSSGGGAGSVRSIAAALEGGAARRSPPGPKRAAAHQEEPPRTLDSTETREPGGARRKAQTRSSPDLDQGPKSDSEEKDSKDPGLGDSASPQSSSSECIPFAEEGNLTIKQRPRAPAPPRAEAVLEPPDRTEVPEFNLKESDTVKRRQKPKDKDQDSPSRAGPGAAASESRIQDQTSLDRPHSPARGSPSKPPLTPKPVRQSLLAAHGESAARGLVPPRPPERTRSVGCSWSCFGPEWTPVGV